MPLKYVRNEKGEFVCPTCGVTKANQNTMHYHMKTHQDSMPFSCRYCKKGFLQKPALDLHIRSRHSDQTNDKKGNFKCACCDFHAMTKGNLRTHCLRSHFQEEADQLILQEDGLAELQCVECERFFQSKTAFYYHCLDCIHVDQSDNRFKIIEELTT
jgi:hypothetical protein